MILPWTGRGTGEAGGGASRRALPPDLLSLALAEKPFHCPAGGPPPHAMHGEDIAGVV